jgi:hypothetical protein
MNVYGILGRKPEKRRQKCRWEGNIKINLRELVRGDMDWIDLVQDRGQWGALVNTVMNLRVP